MKSKLLSKNRRVFKAVELETPEGKVSVLICKPTMGDRAKVLEAATAAGEIDEKGQPTSNANALRLGARVVIATLYDPETRQPCFTPDQADELISDASWLEDVTDDCRAVFAPDVEEAKGK